jgi:hypothetical protein
MKTFSQCINDSQDLIAQSIYCDDKLNYQLEKIVLLADKKMFLLLELEKRKYQIKRIQQEVKVIKRKIKTEL